MFATRRALRRLALALIGLVGAVHAVQAHHSFAMFDTTRRVELTGSVAAFEWTNPHVIIHVDVPETNGTVAPWTIELGSPSMLLRSGWKFNVLKPGDKVALIVNPLRQGQNGGLLVRITLPDGHMLGNGGPPPLAGQ